MATGYETRQGGRDTFASQGPAVQQIGRGGGVRSGNSAGAQNVGGDAAASGTNVQITEAGPSQLGDFFTKMMEPYVERKQQQKFFEGFTRAQSGEAIEELSKSHKGVVGQLFGPTSLEQGAQFYAGMKKVQDWKGSMLDRMDELKKLTPDELSKQLADTSLSMMGDDPYVNMIVQKQLVESSGPLVATVAKERYTWQQDTARQGMHDALDSGATTLQKIGMSVVDTQHITDDETAAMQVSTNSFLQSLQPVAGMSDETIKTTWTNAAVSAVQNGNFYAFTAMRDAGIIEQLDDTQQKKVEDAYDRYKKPAMDDARGKYIEERLDIEQKAAKGELSPLEKVAAVDMLNAKISRDTGIKERAFDADYLFNQGKGVIDDIAAQARRQKERGEAKADREAEQEADARDKHSAALIAFNIGQPTAYLATGGDAGMVNQVYFEGYRRGFTHKFAKAFAQEGYVNPAVAKLMQAKMTSAGGVAYTAEAKQGYDEWQKLYKQDTGAAAAYYGDQHVKMLAMDRLIKGGENPTTAYIHAFAAANAGQYSGLTLRPSDRTETEEAIKPIVESLGSGWFAHKLGFGTRPMGPQATNVLAKVITETTAIYQRNSDQGPTENASQAAQVAQSSNAFEYYGGNLAWRNNPGTKRVGDIIGTRTQDTGWIVYGEINDRLKQIGYRDGADGTYEIYRTPVSGGFLLTVNATDEPGKVIVITSQELKARADKVARGELEGNQWSKPAKRTGMDSVRVGPGK